MPITRTLKRNPSIADVAQARSDFEAAYGPADVLYRGKVYDQFDKQTYSFSRPLPIDKLQPQHGRLVVQLLDGFIPWVVSPVVSPIEPYSFDIVARGARPARQPRLDAAAFDWLNDYRPYAAASKLTDLRAMLKALNFRNPVDAPTEGSITAAFRAKSRRCGIYVLHFANGEYYVGQTVDITKRFLQHRKRHDDIARVSFRPVGRRSLDFHEAQLIRLMEMKRMRLRNISMTSILATEPGAFDEVMGAERQQRWLSDPAWVDLGGERVSTVGSDGLYRDRYKSFKALPYAADVLAVVRAYVHNALPAARSGEASYWQASVLPPNYTVLVRINVNWQEVFFANDDDQGLLFYFVLSKRELQRAFGDNLARFTASYPGAEWEDVAYRAGGSDQVSAWLWDAPTALRFVTDPDVIPALRHYNLRLIKKGKCPWARSHNFDLVTDILSEQPAAVPVGM
jgi:hypothetical protein